MCICVYIYIYIYTHTHKVLAWMRACNSCRQPLTAKSAACLKKPVPGEFFWAFACADHFEKIVRFLRPCHGFWDETCLRHVHALEHNTHFDQGLPIDRNGAITNIYYNILVMLCYAILYYTILYYAILCCNILETASQTHAALRRAMVAPRPSFD